MLPEQLPMLPDHYSYDLRYCAILSPYFPLRVGCQELLSSRFSPLSNKNENSDSRSNDGGRSARISAYLDSEGFQTYRAFGRPFRHRREIAGGLPGVSDLVHSVAILTVVAKVTVEAVVDPATVP